MTHTNGDKYDFKIKEKTFRPNEEEWRKATIKVETALTDPTGEEKIFERTFTHKKRHFKTDRWKRHIKKWIDEMHENMTEGVEIPEQDKVLNAEK
jgi:hypothetical protein